MADPTPLAGDQPPLWPQRLAEALLPAVLLAFVALYLLGLAAGIEPELALGRAGGIALVLAVLARIARGVLDSLHEPVAAAAPPASLDATIGEAPERPAPAADPTAAPGEQAGGPVGSS